MFCIEKELTPWRASEPLDTTQVVAFIASDKYVEAHTSDGKTHILDTAVRRLGEHLTGFVEIMRGVLINPRFARRVARRGDESTPGYFVDMAGGLLLRVSRRKPEVVQRLADLGVDVERPKPGRRPG